MSEKTTHNEAVIDSSTLVVFGDYVRIEMKRYGCPNEIYIHKVIGTLRSNAWVDVPVQSPATETVHTHSEDVVACVCCGVCERNILRYRAIDCKPNRAIDGKKVKINIDKRP